MLIDSHSHVHNHKFDDDRAAVLERAREAGVQLVLTLGDTVEASGRALALAHADAMVFAAAGIHPCEAHQWDDTTEEALRALHRDPRVRVVGEIGLDHYWVKDRTARAHQREVFARQLALARELGKPVSIHARDASAAVLDVLEAEGRGVGGVLHCFSGTRDEARRGLDMGFLLGAGGTCTYPKSADLREVLCWAGAGNVVVETDAPYLPPQPFRGRRNEPAYVRETAQALAAAMGVDYDEFVAITGANACRALNLPRP
jgi:TatD DNase family protein